MSPAVDLGFEDMRASDERGVLPEFVNTEGLLPLVAAVLGHDRPADVARRPWSLSIQLLSAEAMQMFNSEYRGKDRPTNVLSFPFEPPQGLPPEALADAQAELGDIFICPSILEQEALDQNKLLAHHWMHIVIHGILHLLGHDHIEAHDADVMEAIEVALLAELGIDDPYQATDSVQSSEPSIED